MHAYPVERGRRRRVLGRVLRIVEATRATRLWRRLPVHRRQAMLSGGGDGAGMLWAQVPTRAQLQLSSAQWVAATRRRLGILQRPTCTSTCQLPSRAAKGEVCGAVLDQHMHHPSLCAVGPVRMRGHRSLAATLRQAVEREGAVVDLERTVVELFRRRADGTVEEAILDLAVY